MVEGEVETQDTDGVVRGTVERFPPSLFLRETPLTQADPAISRFRTKRARASRRRALSAARPARPAARRHRLRRRPTPARDHGGGSLRAQTRRLPGPEPYLHRAPRAAWAFRPAMSAAISAARTASPRRRRAMPGPKPMSPISAGSLSIRPTAFARPTPCPRRDRPRLSRRRAGARHALRRRRRSWRCRGQVEQADAPDRRAEAH